MIMQTPWRGLYSDLIRPDFLNTCQPRAHVPEETLPGGEVGSLEQSVLQDALHTSQGLDHVRAVVVQVPQLAVVTLVGPPERILFQHLGRHHHVGSGTYVATLQDDITISSCTSANPSHPYACVTVHSTKDPPQVVTFSCQVRVGLLRMLSRSTVLTTYESFCYERDTMHRFYFPLCFKVVQLKEHALSTSIIVSGSFFHPF